MTPPRFGQPRRVVVKVGSSSLRGAGGDLDRAFVTRFVTQLAALRRDGFELVLVSSGAVAAGLAPLGMSQRPADLPRLQAAASVGQGVLMHTYQACFASHHLVCGQVLLTPDDIVDRGRYLNARTTFETLIGLGAVPVVNENDTVATDELRFGDNDRLAALVASMLGAELLVLLSDVAGVLDGRPGAPGVQVLGRVDDLGAVADLDSGGASTLGSGGMGSKLEAVRIARFSATHAVIAAARRPDVVREVVTGAPVGTWFPPSDRRPDSRKLWIAFAAPPRGAVVVDAGAAQALVDRGSSLLPAGVVDATGDFTAGDAVDIVGADGRRLARGLVGYNRQDLLELRGRSTRDLGAHRGRPRAVIHRDSLVLL
ncbi:glutamate 5-kinase [soil metagenome]